MSSNADAIIAGGKCAICGGWLKLHGEPCTPEEDTQALIDAALTANDALWRQAIAEAVPECPKCHGQVTSFISDMEDSAVVSGEEQAECARHCDSEAWERYQERLHRWYNNPDESAKEPRKPKYWSGPLKDAFAAGITTAFTRLSAATGGAE